VSLLSKAKQLGGAADPTFEALHPRVRKGIEGAGQFIDVLGALQDWGAHYDQERGTWNIPKDHVQEFRGILNQLGWTANAIPAGMRPGTPEEHQALRIPPAYTDVYVSHNLDRSNGLLFMGVDDQGRVQRRYSIEHAQQNSAEKFARVRSLADNINALDELLEEQAGDDDTAAAVLLMRTMGLRPGSQEDRRAKVQAYGATTLQRRHVTITGDTVRLQFIAKEGIALDLEMENHRLASALRPRLKGKPGDAPLFPDADEKKTLAFMDEAVPGALNKDLRTHFGTGLAKTLVAAYPVPDSQKAYTRQRNEIADEVAAALGNTRKMALDSYIDPTTWSAWDGWDNPDAIDDIKHDLPLPTPTTVQTALLSRDVLPERSELYFTVDQSTLDHKYGPVDVREVPTGRIVASRARPDGIRNARGLMAKAAREGGDKRDPITLVEQPDGSYRVFDGNSTFAIGRDQGWEAMPAIIARSEAHAQHIADVAQAHKQARKRKLALTTPDSPEVQTLIDAGGQPKTTVTRTRRDPVRHQDPAHVERVHAAIAAIPQDGEDMAHPQAFATVEDQFKQAARDLPKFQDLLRTAGKTFGAAHYDNETVTQRAQVGLKGAMLDLAPLKGRPRAMEKIDVKYDGDHNRLQDVVRGSVVVDTLDDLPGAVEAVRKEAKRRGWKVRKYQDRWLEAPPHHQLGGTPSGYRDTSLALVSPSGTVSELQFTTAPMYGAKNGMGHTLYEQERAIDARIRRRGHAEAGERERIAALQKEQTALYNTAWRQGYG
jgi:DNA topoisomerase-1